MADHAPGARAAFQSIRGGWLGLASLHPSARPHVHKAVLGFNRPSRKSCDSSGISLPDGVPQVDGVVHGHGQEAIIGAASRKHVRYAVGGTSCPEG